MRYLSTLVICLSFVLMACNSQSQDQIDSSNKPLAVTVSNTKTDSIPPKKSRIIIDKARPISQIDTIFPFNIPLKAQDGNIVNSSEILKNDGKPTIVLFWLTTCYPCRIEMKAIQKEVDKWKAETDFNIIAVSTDFEKNYDRVLKMVEDSNWSFDSYWDMNREFRKVLPGKLNGLPQSFIFDKNGKIAYHKRKYASGDEHKLYAKVKELAAK